jgi:hypothetical protein
VNRALLLICLSIAGAAGAQEEIQSSLSNGFTPASAGSGLSILGYVDLGWAKAQGNGTSFAPGDTRIPADYGVDTFATAVNSRGDVASTNSNGRFTNGFLPYSVDIGGHPSFLINTIDLDVRYTPSPWPVMLFTRLQVLPRFNGAAQTLVVAEQAFARIAPLPAREFAVTVGKFDSVFGIEYLENEANLRTGITPSLIARYTTGQGLGAKVFFRQQIPGLWTAVSLNVSATNGGTMVAPLQPQAISLTGTPVFAGRLGLEINLPSVEIKLGVSAMDGPRNDQSDPTVRQKSIGGDARVLVGPLELRGELLRLTQDAGAGDKDNDLGPQTVVSKFDVRGGYGQATLFFDLPFDGLRRIAIYGRYDRRHAQFEGYIPITVDRFTAGARLDIWESIAIKGEYLWNRELEGAPDVDNNVATSSFVYSW